MAQAHAIASRMLGASSDRPAKSFGKGALADELESSRMKVQWQMAPGSPTTSTDDLTCQRNPQQRPGRPGGWQSHASSVSLVCEQGSTVMMPSPRTTVSAACAVTRSVRSLTSAATFIHLSRVIEAFFRGQILRH